MKLILDNNLYDEIWNTMKERFNYPKDFSYTEPFKIFKVTLWNEDQERLVNEIFKQISNKEIYALDWQHDCFIFNPHENIPVNTEWYDEDRDCNVYFPTYYPNGYYYAFVSTDYSYGLMGHPWKNEIYVVGNRLIELFEKHKAELDLYEVNK
ncbi:MAG: DUF2716 domain-containing protein [Oscillospiraceae bacterium]|nr:DUF2716 domain-containing protein [Oscillospiraceae bacterium]